MTLSNQFAEVGDHIVHDFDMGTNWYRVQYRRYNILIAVMDSLQI